MILSPYRNPPYRAPTSLCPGAASNPDVSLLAGNSPKRKRSEASAAKGRLKVNVDLAGAASGASLHTGSGEESPRTKVAEELQDLAIYESVLTTQTTPTCRKRLRRSSMLGPDSVHAVSGEISYPSTIAGADDSSSPCAVHSETGSPVLEIGETPDCRLPNMPSSPPTSTSRSRALQTIVGDLPDRQTPSPSLHIAPLGLQAPYGKEENAADPSLSPLRSKATMSIDQAGLTWQDHEITGHDIDKTSPDDDGEGINGIGFRPTPAMAYARTQKRKQQVGAWRTREAREARQRRFDRRRGMNEFEDLAGLRSKRTVRFMEGE